MAFGATLPASVRLRFRALDSGEVSGLHDLAVDPCVRHFLFDGEIVPCRWASTAIETSLSDPGVGLWLLYEGAAQRLIGFLGFCRFDALGPGPQLVYALRAEHTGKGLALEAAIRILESLVLRPPGFELQTATVFRALLTKSRHAYSGCAEHQRPGLEHDDDAAA